MSEQPKTTDIWAELRKPFPKEVVGILPKPYKKDSPKGKCQECGGYHGLPAVHLDYIGHAAVTDRLNNVAGVDGWNWEPLALDENGLPRFDRANNLWIRLTINGVTKLGVGDGPSAKEIIGDALRNAAMRFGIALDLWSKDELESTLSDPNTKNDKPTAAQPSTPIDKLITAAQATMLVGMAKRVSGLSEREDLIAFIEEEAGKPMAQILQSEVEGLKAKFRDGDGEVKV